MGKKQSFKLAIIERRTEPCRLFVLGRGQSVNKLANMPMIKFDMLPGSPRQALDRVWSVTYNYYAWLDLMTEGHG